MFLILCVLCFLQNSEWLCILQVAQIIELLLLYFFSSLEFVHMHLPSKNIFFFLSSTCNHYTFEVSIHTKSHILIFKQVEILSEIRHRNLVTLIGYCEEGGLQMLVFEYLPNGGVSRHLYGNVQLT